MKRILILLLIAAGFTANAQSYSGDYLNARKRLTVRGSNIDTIKNDTTGLAGRSKSLMTADAVYKFVTGRTSNNNGSNWNLKLYGTSGTVYYYVTPNNYAYSLDSLFYKEMAGVVTKDSEYIKPQVIPYPDEWTWRPVTIQRDNNGVISTTMTSDEFRHRYKMYGKTYYVDNAGSDANSGLTPAAPLLTIGAALAKTDVVEISCDSGYYNRVSWAHYDTIKKSVSIYCPNGQATFGDAFNPSLYVYVAADSANLWRGEYITDGKVYRLDPLDVFGNPVIYQKVSSKYLCSITEGSYYAPGYYDPGYPHTYFNPPGSITPVQFSNVYVAYGGSGRALLDAYGTSRDSLTLYLENIRFIGSGEISRMTDGCKIYAQSCRFVGSGESTDAFVAQFGEEVVLYNCGVAQMQKDGFSYTYTLRAAEIECNGNEAGVFGGTTNQLSTAHGGTNIVRVKGDYRKSSNHIITDINNNTKSFNVGIKGRDALEITFMALDNAKMYMVDCLDSSAVNVTTLAVGGSANMFLQNFKTDASDYNSSIVGGSGFIKYYGLSRNDSAGYFVEKINRVIKPHGQDSMWQYIDGVKYYVGIALNNSGIYTPLITNGTNIDSSYIYNTRWYKMGDIIYVFGEINIDAISAATSTDLSITLPINSELVNSYDLAGTAAHEDGTNVRIYADAINNKAIFKFLPITATNNKYSFHFYYLFTP